MNSKMVKYLEEGMNVPEHDTSQHSWRTAKCDVLINLCIQLSHASCIIRGMEQDDAVSIKSIKLLYRSRPDALQMRFHHSKQHENAFKVRPALKLIMTLQQKRVVLMIRISNTSRYLKCVQLNQVIMRHLSILRLSLTTHTWCQ